MKPKYRIRYQIKWTSKQEIKEKEELKSLLSKISKELKIIDLEVTNKIVLLEISSPPSISVSNIVKVLK